MRSLHLNLCMTMTSEEVADAQARAIVRTQGGRSVRPADGKGEIDAMALAALWPSTAMAEGEFVGADVHVQRTVRPQRIGRPLSRPPGLRKPARTRLSYS